MGKDRKKNLVGQPIFKQIIKMIPRDNFNKLVNRIQLELLNREIYEYECREKNASVQQRGFRRMCSAHALKTQLNETGQVSHYLLWRLR